MLVGVKNLSSLKGAGSDSHPSLLAESSFIRLNAPQGPTPMSVTAEKRPQGLGGIRGITGTSA